MFKRLLLLASFCLAALGVGWRVQHVTSQNYHHSLADLIAPQVAAQGGANCSLTGNNSAVTPGRVSDSLAKEAAHLTLLTGPGDVAKIISYINISDAPVIVRLGAGKDSENLTKEEYASILNQIAAGANKNFIATAGHNEPNCAEYREDRGFGYELDFVRYIGATVTDPKITLITGQIDHYCGDSPEVGGKTDSAESAYKTNYIYSLATQPGIEGLALPYYITDGTPDAASTHAYIMQFANLVPDKDIYITESGPLKQDSFEEFAKSVPLILAEPRVKMMLLFNAFGSNPDGAFTYTKPFWNAACREAFRTQCNDPTAVIEICSKPPSSEYIYQLPNFDATRGSDADRAIGLFRDLVKQGYEVSCTTPRFSSSANISGDVAQFEAAHPPQVAPKLTLTTTQSISVSDAFIPLFRNQNTPDPTESEEAAKAAQGGGTSGKSGTVFDSIEQNFGFQDPIGATTDEELREKNLTAGTFNTLLTRESQCAQRLEALRYRKYLCEQLLNPGSCALNEPIQNHPNYTTETLLSAIEGSGLTCQKIIKGSLTTDEAAMADALSFVPTFLDRAYRLAFLVAVTEMKPDLSAAGTFFNFFSADNNGLDQSKKHHVSVVAFKVPDIGTNRELLDPSLPQYQDPLEAVRDALTPYEQIKRRQEEVAKELDRYTNRPFEGITPKILCGGENCTDPLVKALTDMVNGSQDEKVQNSCIIDAEQLEAEDATIGDSGSLPASTGTIPPTTPTTPGGSPPPAGAPPTTGTTGTAGEGSFVFKPGFDLIKSIFTKPEAQKTNPQETSFSFISNLDLNIKEKSGQSDTVFYVVAPMGYNLEKLEETMVGRIFTLEGRQLFDESGEEVKDYFKTQGLNLSMSSTGGEYSFQGVDYLQCVQQNLTNPNVCLYKIAIKMEGEDSDHAPRVPGGRLGYLIRRMQLTTTEFTSGANKYVTKCPTLDKFFTGSCGGDGTGDDGLDHSDETVSGRKCNPAPEDTPCSVTNLLPYFNGDRQKATIASSICNDESGGSPEAENKSCTYGTDGRDNDGDGKVDADDDWFRQERNGVVFYSFDGGTKDYSVGLFQINLLAHCSEAGPHLSDRPAPMACTFDNPPAMESCRARLLDPEGNIQAMLRVSQNGTNWQPWGGAPKCGVE